MPFAEDFDDVADTIKQAASEVNLSEQIECKRLDDSLIPGRITERLINTIQEAHIIVSDISGNNPNVMWETGFAMALNKPLIQITQSIKEIPFDLKDLLTIEYSRIKLGETLREKLKQAILEALNKFEFDTPAPVDSLKARDILSISVTGSMNLDINKLKKRLKNIITPYVGKKINWLVGSYGDVDEIIASYLCELNESVVIVGYHSYDISSKMVSIIQEYNLPFVDSKKEQLPQFSRSPSERDTYMAVKGDLTLFLWDGKSSGTKKLIGWYRSIRKDHMIGFC